MAAGLTPWQDTQAAVLGACLIDSKAVPKVLGRTSARDFDRAYRPVWLAIAQAFRAGEPVDPVVISNRLSGDQQSRQLMLQLMEATPTAAHVDAYLSALREQSQLAAVRTLAEELAAAPELETARGVLGRLIERIADRPETPVYSWGDLAQRYIDRMQADKPAEYLRWGLRELDAVLYARPGSFIILGGYPSEGKTALAIQFALAQSKGKRVGLFSLETDPDVVFDRGFAHQSELELGKVHAGALSEEERELAMHQLRAASGHRLYVCQASGLTVQDIQAISVARELEVVYIDYVQLIRPDSAKEGRQEQVARISRALHTMAQTTGITVVGLSQLSRPERQSRGKTVKGDFIPKEVPEPSMQDLRESGQLEQDADVILLLWRPYPSDRKQTDRRLKVAKNKEGESGVKLLLGFNGPTQTFAVKDPRSLSQRIRDAGKSGREGSWAQEAQAAKQMTMAELAGPDPDCPF